MEDEKIIVLLSEFISQKEQKVQELLFYQEQLDELTTKMNFLRQEIDLTNKIIKIIEEETVVTIKKT